MTLDLTFPREPALLDRAQAVRAQFPGPLIEVVPDQPSGSDALLVAAALLRLADAGDFETLAALDLDHGLAGAIGAPQ